jgi:cytochrome c
MFFARARAMSDPKTSVPIVLRLLLAGACAAILLAALSFAHPFGNPRPVGAPPGHLLAGAQIPGPLRDLVEHKCGNCHSEAGEWPLYSRIAPVSWLLEHDVAEARAHMNLSRWDAYSNQEQLDLLARLAAQARSGEMPPTRYIALHHDSKLLPEEQESLYDWARAERRRIRAKGKQKKSEQ